MGQLPEGGALTFDQNTRQIHNGGPPWNLWLAECRATDTDNTVQNKDKGHTPTPRTEIKISGPAGNQTRATAGNQTRATAGVEGRDSTDHATTMHIIVIC